MMRVLGVVTARGGSKGVPRKNLAPILGKPLLAYTAEAALKATRMTRVVLSTDDEEIAHVGTLYGLEAPFRRPCELAADSSPTIPTLQHAVREIERSDQPYDAVFTLQPTNPLRTAEDIDGAIEMLERTRADSVISYTEVGDRHPARMKLIATDGTVVDPPFAEAFEGQPRQALPKLFLREGGIYVTKRAVLMEQNSLKGVRSVAWIVPEEKAWSINTRFDLFIAEQMLLRLQAQRARLPVSTEPVALSRRSRKFKILVAEGRAFASRAAEIVSPLGSITLADLTREELLRSLREIEVLWVRLRYQIDTEVMNTAPRLRYILTPTTGLNHVDLVEAERRGIEVISLRGEVEFLRDVHATAEHTIALILALLRKLPAASVHAAAGGWNRDLFQGCELYGKTVGIIGNGRLGKMVTPLLLAFGARVIAVDRKTTSTDTMTLEGVLGEADVVTVHMDLNDDTHGFFDREKFSRMKRTSWFVNTSRGELIDEQALLEALQCGQLSGAALDVLNEEYVRDFGRHPLAAYAREHDNLILTPHIGGCTKESLEKAEIFLAQKFLRMQTAQQREAAYE